jgi:hypothetical protein
MVPDGQDTRVAVLIEEGRVTILEALVDDTDDDAFPGEGRLQVGARMDVVDIHQLSRRGGGGAEATRGDDAPHGMNGRHVLHLREGEGSRQRVVVDQRCRPPEAPNAVVGRRQVVGGDDKVDGGVGNGACLSLLLKALHQNTRLSIPFTRSRDVLCCGTTCEEQGAAQKPNSFVFHKALQGDTIPRSV